MHFFKSCVCVCVCVCMCVCVERELWEGGGGGTEKVCVCVCVCAPHRAYNHRMIVTRHDIKERTNVTPHLLFPQWSLLC